MSDHSRDSACLLLKAHAILPLRIFKQVTLPNLILAWYFSPASIAYRKEHESQSSASQKQKQKRKQESDRFIAESASEAEPTPGDLELTEELLSAFLSSLEEQFVELRFFSGSWGGFNVKKQVEKYDLILTSETIYSLKTMSSLISVLSRSSRFPSKENSARTQVHPQPEQETENSNITKRLESTTLNDPSTLILVAAKVLYFGVGGGVQAFESAIEEQGGWSEEVRRIDKGVGRVVLSVGF